MSKFARVINKQHSRAWISKHQCAEKADGGIFFSAHFGDCKTGIMSNDSHKIVQIHHDRVSNVGIYDYEVYIFSHVVF